MTTRAMKKINAIDLSAKFSCGDVKHWEEVVSVLFEALDVLSGNGS